MLLIYVMGFDYGVKVESWIYKILLKQREYCLF